MQSSRLLCKIKLINKLYFPSTVDTEKDGKTWW